MTVRRNENHPLIGTWIPVVDGDANIQIAVGAGDAGLTLRVTDAFDGEKLEVSDVVWEADAVRFRTVTPSTDAVGEHHLQMAADEQATYRFTVVQSWQKIPDER